MIGPDNFDNSFYLVCGYAPKFVCTDGNTKVRQDYILKIKVN